MTAAERRRQSDRLAGKWRQAAVAKKGQRSECTGDKKVTFLRTLCLPAVSYASKQKKEEEEAGKKEGVVQWRDKRRRSESGSKINGREAIRDQETQNV